MEILTDPAERKRWHAGLRQSLPSFRLPAGSSENTVHSQKYGPGENPGPPFHIASSHSTARTSTLTSVTLNAVISSTFV